MTTPPFELTISLSHDVRLAATAGDLARCAAQIAGCDGATADSFSQRVEEAVRASLHAGDGASRLPVIFRTRSRRLEVLVAGRTLTPDT